MDLINSHLLFGPALKAHVQKASKQGGIEVLFEKLVVSVGECGENFSSSFSFFGPVFTIQDCNLCFI